MYCRRSHRLSDSQVSIQFHNFQLPKHCVPGSPQCSKHVRNRLCLTGIWFSMLGLLTIRSWTSKASPDTAYYGMTAVAAVVGDSDIKQLMAVACCSNVDDFSLHRRVRAQPTHFSERVMPSLPAFSLQHTSNPAVSLLHSIPAAQVIPRI